MSSSTNHLQIGLVYSVPCTLGHHTIIIIEYGEKTERGAGVGRRGVGGRKKRGRGARERERGPLLVRMVHPIQNRRLQGMVHPVQEIQCSGFPNTGNAGAEVVSQYSAVDGSPKQFYP